MTYRHENFMKDVPARGLFYFAMEPAMCNNCLYDMFKEYLEDRLLETDRMISSIDSIDFETGEKNVWVTIGYSFNNIVDIFDEDETTFMGKTKLEFDDEFSKNVIYGDVSLIGLADMIFDLFEAWVDDRLDLEIHAIRERMKEIDEKDEIKERYGVEDE